MSDVVGPDPQYDVFADEFLAHARGGFYNAHYDRPAWVAEAADIDRDAYERLSREPSGFLAIRALRDPRR